MPWPVSIIKTTASIVDRLSESVVPVWALKKNLWEILSDFGKSLYRRSLNYRIKEEEFQRYS